MGQVSETNLGILIVAQQHSITAKKANMILDCTKREDSSPGVPYASLNPHPTRDINKPRTKRKKGRFKAIFKNLRGSCIKRGIDTLV